MYSTPGYDIALCDWGCARHFVCVTDPDTRLTRTWTVPELIAAVMPPCGRCRKPTPPEELDNGGGYCDACWEAEGVVIQARGV